MSQALDLLSQAAQSAKAGIKITSHPSALASLCNALRRAKKNDKEAFGHLIIKKKEGSLSILNGRNLLEGFEEIFR